MTPFARPARAARAREGGAGARRAGGLGPHPLRRAGGVPRPRGEGHAAAGGRRRWPLVEEEIGKVHAEALFTEALGPLDAVKGWAGVLAPALARRRVPLNPLGFPGKRAYVDAVPRGVVAIIAPWNFPVAGLYRSVFPALMSGNAIVLKPSEHSPRSSGWFAERLAAHLPAGVVQVAQGTARWARRCSTPGPTRASSPAPPPPGAGWRSGAPSWGSPAARRWAGRTRPSSSPTATSSAPSPASPTGRCATPARRAGRSRSSTSSGPSPTPGGAAARGLDEAPRRAGPRRRPPTSRRWPTRASSRW